MFIDGVRDFGGYSRDSFNLEQVEVAKGPSSAIAGRGSTGGAINQVSKSPFAGTTHSVSLGGGNADYKRATADVNRQLGDSAAFRLNMVWTDSDVPGRNAVANERWGIAPSIAFGLNGPTRLTVSHLHLTQDNLPEYGLPWVPVNTNPDLAEYSERRIPPVSFKQFLRPVDPGLREHPDRRDHGADRPRALGQHDLAEPHALRTERSRLGHHHTTVRQRQHQHGYQPSAAVARHGGHDRRQPDKPDRPIRNRDAGSCRQRGRRSIAGVVRELRPQRTDGAHGRPVSTRTGRSRTQGRSPGPAPARMAQRTRWRLYAFDTMRLTEQWELTGGFRWDHFDVDSDSTAITGVVTPLGRTDKMTSWRGGAVYKPRPNGSVYLGYATAFNPSAEGLALSAATVLLEPEKTRNFELGTKWDVMGGRLSLSTAGFRTEKTNARTPGINPGDPPTVLAGEQVVNGVELGASGRHHESLVGAERIRLHAERDRSIQHADGARKRAGVDARAHAEPLDDLRPIAVTCRLAVEPSTWMRCSGTRPTAQRCRATG